MRRRQTVAVPRVAYHQLNNEQRAVAQNDLQNFKLCFFPSILLLIVVLTFVVLWYPEEKTSPIVVTFDQPALKPLTPSISLGGTNPNLNNNFPLLNSTTTTTPAAVGSSNSTGPIRDINCYLQQVQIGESTCSNPVVAAIEDDSLFFPGVQYDLGRCIIPFVARNQSQVSSSYNNTKSIANAAAVVAVMVVVVLVVSEQVAAVTDISCSL